jgi:hypothetical protein
VERERRRREPEGPADGARREAGVAGPDQQPEGVEPALLRERGQGGEGIALGHHDSKFIEK